ncbi:MAG: 2,3-bisphosphoglycerate-independent phosphoglycerate mutase [Thaumarchaeota archaeon]|nr:2,3-bisphosphoglycerate-independent phosphoglycerate mutase [Nitrososphaerota archaeon]
MKFGYVLLDGCADRPHPSLNYTTPLEAAETRNLDKLVRRAKLGRVITVGRGISPESDIAVFNMLGYSFPKGYPGRGVIESIGAGIKFRDGQLALRANFATSERGLIVDRRAGRDLRQDEAEELARELSRMELSGAEFEFRTTISYRGVLVIRCEDTLSAEISNTDPAYVRVRGFGAARSVKGKERVQVCKPLSKKREARRASSLVNEFLQKAGRVLGGSRVNAERKRLGKKPANILLLRDAGDHLPSVVPFKEKYGIEGTALVEMPAEVGIARLLGMKEVIVPDHRDLAKKSELFEKELAEGTLVYVHIKGPDEFGHDGDAAGKKKNIEQIDRVFFSKVVARLSDTKVAVSCDHATPCLLKMHSSDPVPLLITTTGRDADCCRFTEKDSRKGSLGTLKGDQVLKKVLSE